MSRRILPPPAEVDTRAEMDGFWRDVEFAADEADYRQPDSGEEL